MHLLLKKRSYAREKLIEKAHKWLEQPRGHIAICFIAFTFINHIKNVTKLQYKTIVKALDGMQLSEIKDNKANSKVYLLSKIKDEE